MTDPDNGTTEERAFWSLNRKDQRLLWVTFVGGAAGVVVGGGILGAAVWLGRSVEHVVSSASLDKWAPIANVLLAIVGLVGARTTQASRRPLRIFYWFVAAVGVLGLLVVVGIGAGLSSPH